jgi:hypothetical protein
VSLHLKHRHGAFCLPAAANRALAAPNRSPADCRQAPNHLLLSKLPRAAMPLSLCLACICQPVWPLSLSEARWTRNVHIGPEVRREGRAQCLHVLKRAWNHAFFSWVGSENNCGVCCFFFFSTYMMHGLISIIGVPLQLLIWLDQCRDMFVLANVTLVCPSESNVADQCLGPNIVILICFH